MSNALAIATVTSTIRYLLERALQVPHPGPVGGASVTTLRPDRLTDPSLVQTPGINVYLYDVRPNHAWNLTDLPTRHPDGALVRRPLAALDLHYLITCYGEDESLDAQRLLGRAVLALAVTPVLTRDVLSAAIAAYSPDVATAFLAESDLGDQVERVKLAPFTLSTEETSKLWGTFSTPHQLSQTYIATVALVEADVSPRTALPVRGRMLTVQAGGLVTLSTLDVEPSGGMAVAGAVVVLGGTGLLARPGATTRVRVGPAVLAPEPEPTAQRLAVTLGDDVPAGLHGVQVVHLVPPSGGAPERVAATSNVLPLLVRPTVSVIDVDADITLAVSPPLRAGQRTTVLLTRLVPGDPEFVTLRLDPVPPGTGPQAEIVVPTADVPAGQWLVRVQVDGVDSVPELVGDVYGAPALTVGP